MNSIDRDLKNKLIVCLNNNILNAYLFGIAGAFVPNDPTDRDTEHAFERCMLVYHQLHSEYPQLRLDERYLEVVNNQLDNSPSYNLYRVYRSLVAQLFIEKSGSCSFKCNERKLKKTLDKIENMIEREKDSWKRYRYQRCAEYEGGLYEYFHTTKQDFLNG